ncbi:MAG: carboxylesterase family protein [Steroidobacteraceae bacterium]
MANTIQTSRTSEIAMAGLRPMTLKLDFFMRRGIAELVGTCVLATLFITIAPAQVPGPTVRIEAGRLSGVPVNHGVYAYLGIPYAAPPVGQLRWKAPQTATPWSGVRAADHFGNKCMQRPLFSDMVFRAGGTSEDCLFLNVWTLARHAGRMPVLVYFYGGGAVAGDGSEPRYDGASFAARGIVTVTVNYRLNIFGQFAHPGLTAESPHRASGYYGYLDQIAALQWVARNIDSFGGDPGRVTIGGESAGSFSVSTLMASPLSRGLIAGAIGESGAVLGVSNWISLAEAEAAGQKFATAVGHPSIAELRALSADELLALSARPDAAWHPTLDGYVFPEAPAAIYAAGEEAHVPLLAGSNDPELSAAEFFKGETPTLDAYRYQVQEWYGSEADAVLAQYPATDDASARHAAEALLSDRFIGQGTWKWVDEVARAAPSSTYYYRYQKPRPATRDGKTPAGDGAVHSGEIEYALGNLAGNNVYTWTPDDEQVSQTMQGFFANFIKTGNPNGAGLPTWPPYASGQVMVIDVHSRAEHDGARDRRRFMDQLPASH